MMEYLEFLGRLHAALRPRVYLEIGGDGGETLRLSRAHSVVVGPDLQLSPRALADQPALKLYREASERFFRDHDAAATLEGRPLDLALIDGFHAFVGVVHELEQIERWGHAGTVVVIHDALPQNSWQASRAFHEGMWTGDVWRVAPFLANVRPDLQCWLVDVGATGALVVTGLDPNHAGMAAQATALDQDFPPDGPLYQREVAQWLREAAPVSPKTVLRALSPQTRIGTFTMQGEGWNGGPISWVGSADPATDVLQITLDEPIQGCCRAALTLSARGMEMLIVRLHYVHSSCGQERGRFLNIVVDVAHPGALLHGLDSVWLRADPAGDVFALDWESHLQPGEALTHLTIAPLDFAMQPTASTPEMHLEIQCFEPRQIAWPRSGTRFAPERFPGHPAPAKGSKGARDAVVFAWWLPDTPAAQMLGEYYLGLLRYHHADSRIFVGINHGSDPAWVGCLEQSGLDIEFAFADPTVQVQSDVGGYLAALGALARGEETFDLVWFGHTKGASRPSFDWYTGSRCQHDRNLWSRRQDIERYFADPRIGLYAFRYALHDPAADAPWSGFGDLDSLERVYRDACAPLGLWAWETVFVMRHKIVRRFCEAVGAAFFRLDPGSYGGSPWWFEAAFPSIASMQGYEPMIVLDTDGSGDPRDDILLYDDPRQTNRLAMQELQRWRQQPFTFAPRALPRGYSRDLA